MGSQETVDLPTFLYRFRSCANSYFWDEIDKAVDHRRIFLSSAAGLNDPYDFCPGYKEQRQKEVSTYLKQSPRHNFISRSSFSAQLGRQVTRSEFRHKMQKMGNAVSKAKLQMKLARSLFNSLRDNTRVACFSERLHCAPMWAHYADNHRGVCLEYEIDWQHEPNNELFPLVVDYRKERPIAETIDVLKYAKSRGDEAEQEWQTKLFEALCLVKSEDWNYEKEWRIFQHSAEPPRYHSAPQLKVSRLIFGIDVGEDVFAEAKCRFSDKVEVCRTNVAKQVFDFDVVGSSNGNWKLSTGQKA